MGTVRTDRISWRCTWSIPSPLMSVRIPWPRNEAPPQPLPIALDDDALRLALPIAPDEDALRLALPIAPRCGYASLPSREPNGVTR